MVRVISAKTMQIVAESQFMPEPVLKIDQVQEAILVQYRDKNGSIILCQLLGKELQVKMTIETFNTGFTQFVACFLASPKDCQRICIVTQAVEAQH